MHPLLLESTIAQCRAYIEAGDCHGAPPPVERLIDAVVQLAPHDRAGAPGMTDAERAAWLADKIGALGDYAKEAAAMLRRWPAGVMVVGTAATHPPCTVCGKPYAEHGTYPTCATHPYTADSRCGASGTLEHGKFVGHQCPGAACRNGCVRGGNAAGVGGTDGR